MAKIVELVAVTDIGVGSGDFWVKVIDYDGTVLLEKRGNNGDSFDLPSAPSHEGLVFQEWSASCPITDGKVVIDNNNIMVGAVYTTTSGKNEFDITLTKVTGLSVTLNMDGTKDWGDGVSDTETTHTYTAYGDYTILCDKASAPQAGGNKDCLRKARLAGVTSIGDNAFISCRTLTSITIPDGVTSIERNTFYSCRPLTSITIPQSVTNIGGNAFYYCSSITKYDFSRSKSIPTLSYTSAFSDINKICKIIVPDNLYDEWIAASNWSTYADYIYKASEISN